MYQLKETLMVDQHTMHTSGLHPWPQGPGLVLCAEQSVTAMSLSCRLQQVRQRWSEIPHIRMAVEKLSKECMDLLNKIFVIDEKKRITIEQIKLHPWYAAANRAAHQTTLLVKPALALLKTFKRLHKCRMHAADATCC